MPLPEGYEIVTDLEDEFVASCAVLNRLWILGWELLNQLSEASDGLHHRVVLVTGKGETWDERKPIAVGVLTRQGIVSLYVKSKFRRQGVGSVILERIKAEFPERRLYAGDGVRGSKTFFERNSVHVIDRVVKFKEN